MSIIVKAPRQKPSDKRRYLRDQLWPDSEIQIWSRHHNQGFITVPRLLPLIMHLMAELSKKGNPAQVYFDLWSRGFDEGLVTITDEAACAYSSGYVGQRAIRTWKEHIRKLEGMGFIRTKPHGNREYGYVLLRDPIRVCVELNSKRRLPIEWWASFVQRAGEIGATLSDFTQPPPSLPPTMPTAQPPSHLPPQPPVFSSAPPPPQQTAATNTG